MTPWSANQWAAHKSGADIDLNQHGQMRLRFLSDSMARVTVKPSTGYREPNTWAISPLQANAPTHPDTPWQGRSRDDLSGFATPSVQHQQSDEQHSGAFFGWWQVATKLNLALAAGFSLPLLQWLGYASGSRDAPALLALSWAYALLPCILKLLAAAVLYFSAKTLQNWES